MTVTSEMKTQAAATKLPATVRRVVLTGFMGAGKTTVGRLLAEALGWTFMDLDGELEARAGVSVPEIFAQQGERGFRRMESRALAALLGKDLVVIALGGGTPEELTNRLLLEQTPGTVVVFLDAPFAALYDRCMLQALGEGRALEEARPVLRSVGEAEARFAMRQPMYRRLARVTVGTGDLTSPEVVSAVLGRLLVDGR